MAITAGKGVPVVPAAERRRRRLNCLLFLMVAMLALLRMPCALAGSVSATMNVSVMVVARAVLNVSSEPATVIVTQADVDRGYVDLRAPIALVIRTNSRAGYLLQVDRLSAVFSHVDLTFGDSVMSVGQQAWISRPYVPGGESLVMKARVFLAATVQPGTYPLSLAFSARPL